MTAAMRGLTPGAIPRASVAIRIFQQLGGSLGSAILFVVLEREITNGGTPSPATLGSAFGATFWWVVVLAALALIPTLFLPRRSVRPAPEAADGSEIAPADA